MDMEDMGESESPWGPRIPVEIDTTSGIMKAGNASRPIDVNGDVSVALSSYLSMVYELRSQSMGVIPLRQEDLISLANVFEMEETDVAERLARLMHCDDLQTHRFVQMVKKGRVLVPVSMVAAGTVLAVSLALASPAQVQNQDVDTKSQSSIELVTTTTPRTTTPVTVNIGEAVQVQKAEPNADASTSTQSNSVLQTGNAPEVGPGEVIIGEGISVSRDN